MSQAQTVTATFSQVAQTFALTVATAGNGTGSVTSDPAGITCPGTCTNNFASGTAVTLTATPAAGSTFAGWSGACSGTGPCTVTMTAAKSVTATFDPPEFTLGVSTAGTGAGAVTSSPAGIGCPGACSARYTQGTAVTLTAAPNATSAFAGWSGACTGAGTCVVTMSGAQSVTATFNTITFPLTVTISANNANATGTVTSSPAGIACQMGAACPPASFAVNTLVTLTAAPGAGSHFAGWSGACSGTSPTCTVTMSQARTVTASFRKG
jgi:hypothetical protein